MWLQVFITVMALICAWSPWAWFGKWFCWIPGNLGPCVCDKDWVPLLTEHNEVCWMSQMIYRVEMAGTLVYLIVLLLCVSGCSDTAAHGFPVLKFAVIPVAFIVFLFIPNSVFNVYGDIANILASVFVIAQALLLIDLGYTVNEKIMTQHTSMHRRNLREDPTWKIVILVLSALLFVGSITGSILLFVYYKDIWIVIVALVLALVFGVLSVTCAWCPHGNILTSCIVMAYSIWLSYEALLTINQDAGRPVFIKWIGLAIAAFSLFGTAFGNGLGLNGGDSEALAAQARVDAATEEGAAGDAAEGGSFDKKDFIIQSAIHAACAMYITTELAADQYTNKLAFAFRSIDVIGALLLFGFTLFAPKLFPDRSF